MEPAIVHWGHVVGGSEILMTSSEQTEDPHYNMQCTFLFLRNQTRNVMDMSQAGLPLTSPKLERSNTGFLGTYLGLLFSVMSSQKTNRKLPLPVTTSIPLFFRPSKSRTLCFARSPLLSVSLPCDPVLGFRVPYRLVQAHAQHRALHKPMQANFWNSVTREFKPSVNQPKQRPQQIPSNYKIYMRLQVHPYTAQRTIPLQPLYNSSNGNVWRCLVISLVSLRILEDGRHSRYSTPPEITCPLNS